MFRKITLEQKFSQSNPVLKSGQNCL